MTEEKWVETFVKFAVPTNKMILSEAKDIPTTSTKVGGSPWWPENEPRPVCVKGHPMTFIAQINLSDLPLEGTTFRGLYSFHYCNQCMYEGNMAFGWKDDQNKGYDVRVFEDLEKTEDSLGFVSKTVLESKRVELIRIDEVPEVNDLPPGIYELIPDAFFEYEPPDNDNFSVIPGDNIYPGLKHVHSSKIGGAPTWVQDPEWPNSSEGHKMKFVAQLDCKIGEESAWAGGTAFLFLYKNSKGFFETEMLLQST